MDFSTAGFGAELKGVASARRETVAHGDVFTGASFASRAFAGPDNSTATMHIVDIREDSRVYYHKKLTEIYLVLEGSGQMELDGEKVPVTPFAAIFIKPGCRHRAVGKMRIVNVCIPPLRPRR
jgi:mannose-6-phosphate isomerase-like protein (cupin superfamily)